MMTPVCMAGINRTALFRVVADGKHVIEALPGKFIDRRPNTVTYSAVWGWRPPPLQKEYPHWDWRTFAEMSGDSSSKVRRGGQPMPGTGGDQVFVGPAALGIFKNYAVEGGIQFPVYRNVGAMQMQERYRFAINLSRFF